MSTSLSGTPLRPRSFWERVFGRLGKGAKGVSFPVVAALSQSPAERLAGALEKEDEPAAARVVASCEPSQWTTLPCGRHVLDVMWSGLSNPKHAASDCVRLLTRKILARGVALPGGTGERIFIWALQQDDSQYALCLSLLDAGVSPHGSIVTSFGVSQSWVRYCLRHSRPMLALELLRHGASALELTPDGNSLLHDLAISSRRDDDCGIFGFMMSRHSRSAFEKQRMADEEPATGAPALLEVLEYLCTAGVDVRATNNHQQTVYSLAGYSLRHTLLSQYGVSRAGVSNAGRSLAYEAASRGHLQELSALWNEDRASFMTPDSLGCLPSWGWWSLSDPAVASNVIDWFKSHDVWHESIAITVPGHRNFLMYGLQGASTKSSKKDAAVDMLDWQLARLETELAPEMWFSPDSTGETMSFWFRAMGREDLLERYVLPRKEAFLKASLAHVEVTQQKVGRARF